MPRPKTYRGAPLAEPKAIVYHQKRIGEVQERIETAQALLDLRVIAARADHVSWRHIAEAVGITRQSATERFVRIPEVALLEEARP